MPEPPPVEFELRPHRSLGRAGFLALMGCVAAASFGAGAAFALAGAWPIMGFFGLDAVLIWLAFRLNYRGGRTVERVRLSPEWCEVERVAPSGRARRRALQTYWLRIALEAPDGHRGRLALSSRGTRVVIGAFLPPDERRALYRALSAALARLRAGPVRDASPSASRMS